MNVETLGKANIGLSNDAIEKITVLLAKFLSDIQILYVKTLGFHWNVIDPRFYLLHELFEEQYLGLQKDADEMAERIRKLGRRAPASLKEFLDRTSLVESVAIYEGNQMIEALVKDYELLIREIREAIILIEDLNDQGTVDMLTQLIRNFESRAWMLRSHLGEM